MLLKVGIVRDFSRESRLWEEWPSELHPGFVVFFTYGHPSLEHDVVRGALARALQTSGTVDGLGHAYKRLEAVQPYYGWSGIPEDSTEMFACDESGETTSGEIVPDPRPTTWVEVPDND